MLVVVQWESEAVKHHCHVHDRRAALAPRPIESSVTISSLLQQP
jgi:hypothetical protein